MVRGSFHLRCVIFLILFFPALCSAVDSTCYGTTSSGSLKDGVKLPASGENYTNYSRAAILAGRTYVHSEVMHIVVSAYEALELSHPDKVFKYAETGKKNGGIFKPHKTHQNGLSIDFMTPMKNSKGKSVHLQLHKIAKAQGHDLWRVILAPELQPPLFDTEYGNYLAKHVQFSKNRSWVRHDEHYHVDFEVACETG